MSMAMTATEDPMVRTKPGELRGTCENGIAVFRSVPYAAAPVGELRFAPPQPAPVWRGGPRGGPESPRPPPGGGRLAPTLGGFAGWHSAGCAAPDTSS